MRNIKIEITSFAPVGCVLWLNFIDNGWVDAVVRDVAPTEITLISMRKKVAFKVNNWYEAMKQGNIIHSPN
jgi:hypothetical protein